MPCHSQNVMQKPQEVKLVKRKRRKTFTPEMVENPWH